VTGDDVSPGGTPRGSGAPDDVRATDAFLAGRRRAETEDEMTLDRLLGALRAPGTADELRGLEAASAAFVQARVEAVAAPALVAVGGRARRSVAAGAAVAAVLATVSLSAAAAAAYTGALPRAWQQAAHDVIGAPAPESAGDTAPVSDDRSQSSPAGASAHGSGPAVSSGAPALFGLCTAFRDRGPGAVPTGSVAYRDLFAAADAEHLTIDQYCSALLPDSSRGPSVPPSNKPTVRPTPSGKSTDRPTPSRKPSDVPRSDSTTRSSSSSDKGSDR